MATLFLNVNNGLHQILRILTSTREAWVENRQKPAKQAFQARKTLILEVQKISGAQIRA